MNSINKQKKYLLLTLFLSGVIQCVVAQNEMPVNLYRGTPQVNVPIWTITSHDLSESISLVYDPQGLRVDQPNGKAGLGWSLHAGGSITREVRGLPDDFTSSPRNGWLYSSNVKAASLANTSDLSATTCTDEITDHNGISTISSFSSNDSEPDIFTFSADGLYGKFVFDNSATPQVRLIPYQDIKIDVTYNAAPTDLQIKSFTITTNDGVKYFFGYYDNYPATNIETRATTKLTSELKVEYLKTNFELYNSTTAPTYNKEWMLVKVISPSGDYLTYSYLPEVYVYPDTIRVTIMKKPPTVGFTDQDVYEDRKSGTHYNLNTIRSSAGPWLQVNYTTPGSSSLIRNIEISDDRQFPFLVRTFGFSYEAGIGTYRESLVSLQESNAGVSLPPYKFGYHGGYIFESPYSKRKDFWGYYNGKNNTTLTPKIYVYPDLDVSERYRIYPIPNYTGVTFTLDGADRTPDPEIMKTGSLTSITYPWDSKTTLEYEANMYYDPVSATNNYGQGLRVKSIMYEDILNPDTKIIKTYNYTEIGGNSSGRILHYPAYAMANAEYRSPGGTTVITYDSDVNPTLIFNYFTVRTAVDLFDFDSFNDESVGYKTVNVYKAGSGHTQFEFLMPGTYGESAIGEWTPTLNKFARPNSCPSMAIVNSGGVRSFPFAADPNFDHERGLLWKKQEFNETSVLIRKTETTFQYLYSSGNAVSTKVWAYHYEKYPNSIANTFFFGKYYLLTDVVKGLLTETVTSYDALATTKNQVNTTAYQYTSPKHKLVTKIVSTKADGTVYVNYFRYPLDYGIIPTGSDTTSQMIGLLQSNFRNGTPIEQYSTINKNGSGEYVTGGSVMRFNDFGLNQVLVKDVYQWNVSSALLMTNFIPSFIDATTKTFTLQTGYGKVLTYLEYDAFAMPKCSIDQSGMVNCTVWSDHTSVPFINVKNARLEQVAFSDFEYTNPRSFDLSNTSTTSTSIVYAWGRIGQKSVYSQVKLSKQLTKGYGRYTFSGWWNKASGSLDINIVVMNTAKTTTFYNRTFTIPKSNSPSGWEYFDVEFPIDPALTEFYIEIKPNAPASVFLDDVSLYPSNASIAVSTYTFPFGQASLTTGDKTIITEYDKLGRVKYVKDKDRNILEKRTYNYTIPRGNINPPGTINGPL